MTSPAPASHPSVLASSDLALAEVYGEALGGVAVTDCQAQDIADELDGLVGLMDEIDGFDELLAVGSAGVIDAAAMVERVFAGRVSEPVGAFLAVLARNGRLGLLRAIARQFRRLLNARQGRIEMTITTAGELTSSQRLAITAELEEIFDAGVILASHVDERIIGGLKLSIGDCLYDASVSGQLARMHRVITTGQQDLLRRGDGRSAGEGIDAFGAAFGETGRVGRGGPAVQELRELFDRQRGRVALTVTTAIELDSTQRDRILGILSEMFGAEPIVEMCVDETILGGLKICLGDCVYDASVAAELRRMGRTVIAEGPSDNLADEIQDDQYPPSQGLQKGQ